MLWKEFKMFILAPPMYNKLLSETIENKEGKSHNCLSGNAGAVSARRSERALGFIDLVWLESSLPHRKAAHSCPLGEPAWKEYRSYWVIKACQHLGYAAWFNPIMWMEPVIALMKSTPVWKGPWMIFLFIFCLHVTRYWCRCLLMCLLVS